MVTLGVSKEPCEFCWEEENTISISSDWFETTVFILLESIPNSKVLYESEVLKPLPSLLP